jgi:ATP synthase protein I
MNNTPFNDGQHDKSLAEQIGQKAERKRKAHNRATPGVWFGLGMMGLVGWSIVVPTLLGAMIGIWLDKHYAGAHTWTLSLLVAGLVIGCFNAWQWIDKEHYAMRDDQEGNDD